MLTKRNGLIALGVIAVLVMCTISAVVGGALSHNFGVSAYTISYADFISIMLTAVSVLLALVTIVLAVAGVLGWTAISNGVRSRTEAFLEEGFKEGNSLYSMVESRVTAITYAGARPVSASAQGDDTQDDESEEEVG